MKGFVCGTCGHIEFDQAPEKCPVCGSPKEVFAEKDAIKTEDEGKEKHVPVITISKECSIAGEGCIDINARIGETLHPMIPEHHIMWLDFYINKRYAARMMLTPDCNPAATAHLKTAEGKLTVIEFCNVHGHWISEQDI